MAEKKAEVLRSEATKDLTAAKFKKLQEEVAKMTPEALKAFRGIQDADAMGFDGEEGI